MTPRSEWLSADLYRYLVEHSTPVDPVLHELAAETRERFAGSAGMQIGPEQGAFMTFLARLSGAGNAVEVGTFTGYSSICIARGLATSGHLLCCDVSDEWTSLARRYWDRAGVADRIELRLAPALDTLRGLALDTHFDFAFIDADKPGYVGYWEEIVPRVRSGGIILADNTLFHGAVIDPADTTASVQGIRDFNDHALARRPRRPDHPPHRRRPNPRPQTLTDQSRTRAPVKPVRRVRCGP
jgi:caffeoyl-CoA O-methyltransferase